MTFQDLNCKYFFATLLFICKSWARFQTLLRLAFEDTLAFKSILIAKLTGMITKAFYESLTCDESKAKAELADLDTATTTATARSVAKGLVYCIASWHYDPAQAVATNVYMT